MSRLFVIYMSISQKLLHKLATFLCSLRAYPYSFAPMFSAVEITSLNNLFPLSLRACVGLMTICCITNPTVKEEQIFLPPILNNSCVSMSGSIWALGTIWNQALSGRSVLSNTASLPSGAWWPRGEFALWAGGEVVHGLENVGMMNAFGPAYIVGVGWAYYLNTQLPPPSGLTWPGQ